MPKIQKIREGKRGGRDGFIITWEMNGFTEQGARFRAITSTAMRFPTTITSSEVTGVSEFGDNDYNVDVFVPSDGFASAGIPNPVEWLQDNFGSRFRS